MRADVEDLDQIALGGELVGEQKLLGSDLELHDPDALERAYFGLAGERVLGKARNGLGYSGGVNGDET